MDGRINVAKAPELMVSRRRPSPVEKANPASIPGPNSPLENTLHKAGNGEIPITCRNRHCPKCQTAARNRWVAERQAEVLPVGYFHVVFTLPHELCALALRNKKELYLSLIHISEPTRRTPISYAVFCLKKKK